MNAKIERASAVFLVGFMGCGKTAIGRLLAQQIRWSFVDLDDDIEARMQMSIPRIFDQFGEAEFRRIEHEALAERVRQIEQGERMVVALGGGAFVQPANQELIAAHGLTIWLDCAFEVIERRVAQHDHRPLARDPQTFRKLFAARQPAYAKAEYRVDSSGDDPAEAVRQILALPGLF